MKVSLCLDIPQPQLSSAVQCSGVLSVRASMGAAWPLTAPLHSGLFDRSHVKARTPPAAGQLPPAAPGSQDQSQWSSGGQLEKAELLRGLTRYNRPEQSQQIFIYIS